jgi:hypothetical protein
MNLLRCLSSRRLLFRFRNWHRPWIRGARSAPKTDIARHTVPLDEIISRGPPEDGIPSIDDPTFMPVAAATDLSPQEPVIALVIGRRCPRLSACA